MVFLQYIPRPEDHVLGIVVDSKTDVSPLTSLLISLYRFLFGSLLDWSSLKAVSVTSILMPLRQKSWNLFVDGLGSVNKIGGSIEVRV